MRTAFALVSGAILASSPIAALAQTLGQVTAYNDATLRTYNPDGGRRSTATPISELATTPTAIVDIQSGGRIGINDRNGQRVFVRGMDVDFELNDLGRARAGCQPVTSANRAAGAVVAGQRAGGGSSTDCAAR